MINKPQVWAAVFATQNDRRSFVEMCLERSYPIPLEVTVGAHSHGPVRPSCTCDEDPRSRFVPNEIKPCEWHFAFESLAEARHLKRIRALEILFDEDYTVCEERVPLALGSCRFFDIPSLQLTRLKWTDMETLYANHLFSASPFVSTLRSLSFQGSWGGPIMKLNNLTSVTFAFYGGGIDAESFRTFILNNESLESLSLDSIEFKGTSNEHPVTLSNLKSFSVYYSDDYFRKIFSTLFRVPALQRLSSLVISVTDDSHGTYLFTLRAVGDDIAFTVECDPGCTAEAWEDLTGYAGPTIQRVRLENPANLGFGFDESDGVLTLLKDAHTLEIGYLCQYFYPALMDGLKQLGTELKTVRFEAPEEAEPLREGEGYEPWGGMLLDDIQRLVVYRFLHGRPFSSVERMVVSGSERVNRQQDFVWRCFYSDRFLDQFVRPE